MKTKKECEKRGQIYCFDYLDIRKPVSALLYADVFLKR